MNKYIQKDLNRRVFVKIKEHKRITLKSIQQNRSLPPKLRFFAQTQLGEQKTKSSPVQVRNRCVLTGRSRGVYNYFKISRIMIRHLASQGLLPGLKKST
jgi:small subunit ribosomal protein S14